jgi:branched-subunit amino acid ABC-type transport system permease component
MGLELLILGIFDTTTILFWGTAVSFIYRIERTLNFSLAAAAGIGGYLTFVAYGSGYLPFSALIVLVLVAGAIFGLTVDALIFHRLLLRKASSLSIMIASIGLLTMATAVLLLLYGGDVRAVRSGIDSTYRVLGVVLTNSQIFTFLVALGAVAVMYYVLLFSMIGWQIMALGDNPVLMQALGFDAGRIRRNAICIAYGSIALAGALWAYQFGVTPQSFMAQFLTAAITAVMAGTGSYLQLFSAAIVLGALRNLSLLFLSAEWLPAVTSLALLALLLVKRQTQYRASKD